MEEDCRIPNTTQVSGAQQAQTFQVNGLWGGQVSWNFEVKRCLIVFKILKNQNQISIQ